MAEQKRPAPELLLDHVADRASFLEFLWALVEERELVEEEGRKNPALVIYGSPRGWQNHEISAFLGAAAVAFDDARYKGDDAHLSWRDLAEFLWLGKIYE